MYQVQSTMYNVQSIIRSKIQEPRNETLFLVIRDSYDSRNPLLHSTFSVRYSTLVKMPYFIFRTSYFYFTFPAGFPNTVSFFPTEEITTDPAPTRAPLPMLTPETMVTPEPINAPSSKTTSAFTIDPAPT